MANNNSITLIGNLGEAPKTYQNDNGDYTVLRLATTDSYKDEKTGQWQDKAPVWHTIFAFGSNVKGYANSFKKGDRIKVAGTLTYRTTKVSVEGQPRNFVEATITAHRIEDARLPKKGA